MPHLVRNILGHRGGAGVLVGAAALATAATAQAQVRVVSYNITDLVGDTNAIRTVLALAHLDAKSGFAVPVGVFRFCEVRSPSVFTLLNLVNSAAPSGYTYALATFTSSSTEDSASGAQALIYRTDLLAEIPSGHVDLSTGANRKTDRWLLRLQGYDSTAARFYVYGSHLKASTGTANVFERLAGVQTIRANSDALGAGVHTLYSGDMNFYSNTEDGYLAFLGPGNGAAWDPLGTGSWAGSANAVKHTQSPRDITAGGLVGGGMDDRFDFILPTAEFNDNDGLSFIPGSYRAMGNDGAHYDQAINVGNNTYYPDDLALSNALADALFAATDHIPVIADFRVPAKNQATLVAPAARVIQNAAGIVAQVRVSNAAAGVPAGVASMPYLVSGTGVLSGSGSGTAPLTPSFATVSLPVATGTIGLRTGNAVASTSAEAAQSPSITLPVSLRVLRRSNPSLSAPADANTALLTGTVEQDGAPIEFDISVTNYGSFVDQALMDIDGAVVVDPEFALLSVVGQGIGVGAGTVTVAFDPAGLPPGTYETDVQILTSDENVPGETDDSVVATLRVTIEGDPCTPGDIDCSGSVDGADLGLLLAGWGLPGATDLNGDGSTDGADLGILLSNWGT